MTPFDRALKLTLGFEGGASSDPNDTAGRGLPFGSVHTYKGITQRLYDLWRSKNGLPRRHVIDIEDSEIRRIAMDEFWMPCKCDHLPDEIAIAVFDMAFHSSPRDAAVALQKAVGTRQDGVIGEKTLEAVRQKDNVLDLLLAFLKARGAEMQEIIIHNQSQVAFLEGWINRLLDSLHNAHRRAS